MRPTVLAPILVVLVATAAPAPAQGPAARQVTLFGIVATPGSAEVDPKLQSISAQLRKLKPGHGFKLLDVASRRLSPGQSVAGDFGQGLRATAELVDPIDPNGKVLLRFGLERNGGLQAATIVSTPPNQLFFIDQEMPDRTLLLIGIGAR